MKISLTLLSLVFSFSANANLIRNTLNRFSPTPQRVCEAILTKDERTECSEFIRGKAFQEHLLKVCVSLGLQKMSNRIFSCMQEIANMGSAEVNSEHADLCIELSESKNADYVFTCLQSRIVPHLLVYPQALLEEGRRDYTKIMDMFDVVNGLTVEQVPAQAHNQNCRIGRSKLNIDQAYQDPKWVDACLQRVIQANNAGVPVKSITERKAERTNRTKSGASR